MLKNHSLAKITLMLLSTASLSGIALAQSASPEPAWPSDWTKPSAAYAPIAAGASDDALSVLDEPFELDGAVHDALSPMVGDQVVDPLLDAPAGTVAAQDPLAGVDGIAVPDEMTRYISDAPAADASGLDPLLAVPDAPVEVAAPATPIRVAPSGGNPLTANVTGATEFAEGSAPDPVASAATELVRESGLIARQSDMGEGLLLMDRQLRFAENVNQMIAIMGPDVEIEVAPGVYQSYADTPAGRKAQLEMKRLEQEAEFANLDFQLQLKEREAKLLEAASSEEASTTPDGLQPLRSDGGEFQDINNAVPASEVDPLAGLDPAVVAAPSSKISAEIQASLPKPEAAPPAEPSPTLSLREIFGTGDEFVAVLTTNGERVRVRSGDDLPGGVKVIAVGEDFVEIETNGAKSRLSIRG